MNTSDNGRNAHNQIDFIFKNLLPAHGMTERPVQIELAHRMLDAMLRGGIALCDAGTGIGKTYAYLIAGIVFQQHRTGPFQPILISTSSIALQNAVQQDYLPFLSNVLGMPILAMIRKGKSHYVCDARLERRLRRIDRRKKNAKAVSALLSLRGQLDMDRVSHLSGYDRERVCVPQNCDCKKADCRYRRYVDSCESSQYPFQICNHNLLLADAIHRSTGRRPILPDRCALIIDEAHKLPEAAREMFGITLEAEDFQAMARSLWAERYLLAAERLTVLSKPLLKKMVLPYDEDRSIADFLRQLVGPNRGLAVIQRQLRCLLTPATRSQLEKLASTVLLFRDGNDGMMFYTQENKQNHTTLCATITDLTAQLRSTLWSQEQPMILTSGTLAVGNDFHRFRADTGLTADSRVSESVSLSPFDYRQNCLLYFPQRPPRRQEKGYDDQLAAEIICLLGATHGHALILFTSYAALSATRERLAEQPWQVFALGRNSVHTVEQFKTAPGSILLAAGAAWEGFDFPGDCVSLLVIPRLPFPRPDARKEKERENYPTLREFIRAVIIPEMQIKLKQGFGRAIRTETDTCVIAILDDRAAPGGRYHNDILAALPEMPMTDAAAGVEQFIRRVKGPDYFREGDRHEREK
ncbi:MAG: ATP-dependent DNA helicase [Oscillospiraceae bacterium]|nr:ATP-dependent DNA helicase [Oscillospiraceae bacterium]